MRGLIRYQKALSCRRGSWEIQAGAPAEVTPCQQGSCGEPRANQRAGMQTGGPSHCD